MMNKNVKIAKELVRLAKSLACKKECFIAAKKNEKWFKIEVGDIEWYPQDDENDMVPEGVSPFQTVVIKVDEDFDPNDTDAVESKVEEVLDKCFSEWDYGPYDILSVEPCKGPEDPSLGYDAVWL